MLHGLSLHWDSTTCIVMFPEFYCWSLSFYSTEVFKIVVNEEEANCLSYHFNAGLGPTKSNPDCYRDVWIHHNSFRHLPSSQNKGHGGW